MDTAVEFILSLLWLVVVVALPGLLFATIACCLRGWNRSLFWRLFAEANMVVAWFPVLFFAIPWLQGHGGRGTAGIVIIVPILFVLGLLWFLASLQLYRFFNKAARSDK